MTTLNKEYWITSTGNILTADSHYNHIAHVCKHIISLIYSNAWRDPVANALINEIGEDAKYWDDDATALREALLNASDSLSRLEKYEELYEDYEPCLVRSGVPQEALDALWRQDVDARLWAMEECDWTAIRDNQIVTYGLNDKKLCKLRDSLWNILLENGVRILTEYEFYLNDTLANTRFVVTLESMEDGRVSSLKVMTRANAAAIPGR